jgi:hypothetical protein
MSKIYLTQAILASYIGGQIEIQNPAEGYLYRGEISQASLTQEDTELNIKMAWMAKGEGYPQIPFRWVESNELTYGLSLQICQISDIGPGSEGGNTRIQLNVSITGETVVLFPPNGSKLDRNAVAKA